MINLAVLERDLAAKQQEGLALIKSIGAKCQAENRAYTDEERSALKTIQDEGLALKHQIAQIKGDDEMAAEIQRLTAGVAPLPERKVRGTMGEQFVGSAEYQQFVIKDHGHRTQSSWRMGGVELFDSQLHATTLTEGAGSGGPLILPMQKPGILPLTFARLVVANLLASGTTDSNVVAYMKEKTWTSAAATVAEGAAKPESTLVFEAVSDPVRKIAHWLPVTEEMLEDVSQIRSYIDARLRLGVQVTEEDQLLNGDGVAPNILGLRLRAGLTADVVRGAAPAVAGEPNADAILRQIMGIYAVSFLMPDGVIVHPTNWVSTILAKNTTGDYLTAGPFSPIQSPTLWGLPVVLTPAITANTALVGAFQAGAQVFRKGGIRVEASNSHQDFFIKNLVAIRAEERLALAVYRPAAFGEVTALT